MAEAASRVAMDPNFELRLRELRDQAAVEAAARAAGKAVPWMRPGPWAGDPTDPGGYGVPFDRTAVNAAAVAAMDPQAPGTTGDVVAATTMIGALAGMERAFRSRHTLRRTRATAHLVARKRAHGGPDGVLTGNGVGYLREVLKQSLVPS